MSTTNLALLFGGGLLVLYVLNRQRTPLAGGQIGGVNWSLSGPPANTISKALNAPGVQVDSTGSLIAGIGSAAGNIISGISDFFP